jgi:hypothetical protein
MKENISELSGDGTVIKSTADRIANQANMTAIDKLVTSKTYPYIIAWGKWLGFTPDTVQKYVTQAEADKAPLDVVQKIDGAWVRLDGIVNDTNRKRVIDLANVSTPGSWSR